MCVLDYRHCSTASPAVQTVMLCRPVHQHFVRVKTAADPYTKADVFDQEDSATHSSRSNTSALILRVCSSLDTNKVLELRSLVDTGHSKAHRNAIGGLLASLMSQIMGGVAKDRGLEAYRGILHKP